MELFWEWMIFINDYFSTTVLALSVLVAIIIGIKEVRELIREQSSVAYQSIINSSLGLERFYIENPKLYIGMRKSKEYIEKLPEEDKTRINWITMMTLDFFDNLLYQKNRGVLRSDSEEWINWKHFIENEFESCSYLSEFLLSEPGLYTKELLSLASK